MGGGSFSFKAYADYSASCGKTYDTVSSRVIGQEFKARHIDESLDPKNFTLRECVNSEEHPNTVPVILALDVTGSMGGACKETAEALGVIMTNLYKKYKDIEFCIMGIGDLAYDDSPIQMSQFESDVRIAEAIDKVYLEFGGGGNGYESYTAAWYMGLHGTKLDCFDNQGRKGIIITMGDEPMNPYLPKSGLSRAIGRSVQADVNTEDLYEQASKKFDIFHIAVDDKHCCYSIYKEIIKGSFGKLLGDRFKVSTIQNLADTISGCIAESIESNGGTGAQLLTEGNVTVTEEGISW